MHSLRADPSNYQERGSLRDKRAVSQKGGIGECTRVPVFVLGEHANVPSFRFSFRENMRTYPRSGFCSGRTSECTLVPVFVPKEHPPKPRFGNHPFVNPRESRLRYFRKPLRAPRPTESQSLPATKKKIPRNPKTPIIPKSKRSFPKRTRSLSKSKHLVF